MLRAYLEWNRCKLRGGRCGRENAQSHLDGCPAAQSNKLCHSWIISLFVLHLHRHPSFPFAVLYCSAFDSDSLAVCVPLALPRYRSNGTLEMTIVITPPQHPHPDDYASLAFSTRALHVGSEHTLSSVSAVIPSINLSTTYAQSHVGVHKGFEYTRSANPTRLALERVLASLEKADTALLDSLRAEGIAEEVWEGGPAALAFSSGSAATATVE